MNGENAYGVPTPIREPAKWEQVWQGDGEGQASIIAGALEEQGIDTHVRGTQPMPQAYPTAWARNNWVVLVRSGDAARAREHLRETGEEVNVVDGTRSFVTEQVFMLKLAVASLLALAIASAIGVLFFDWGA